MKTPKPETALILRTCNADLTSHGAIVRRTQRPDISLGKLV